MKAFFRTSIMLLIALVLCSCSATQPAGDSSKSEPSQNDTAAAESEDDTTGAFTGLPEKNATEQPGSVILMQEQSMQDFAKEHGSLLENGEMNVKIRSSEGHVPDDLEQTEQDGDDKEDFDAIIGSDDRFTVYETYQYPYSAIGLIEAHARCGCDWTATGFMVRPTILLTAAHAVWCEDHQQPLDYMTVYFGYQQNGNYTYRYSDYFDCWYGTSRPSEYRDWDFGIIRMHENVGDVVGWFGFQAESDKKLEDQTLRVAGYRDGVLKYDTGTVHVQNKRRMTYAIDAMAGNSGAPVFDYNSYTAKGIHVAERTDGTKNIGVRITQEVVDKIFEAEGTNAPTTEQLVVDPYDTGRDGYVLPYSSTYRYTRSDLSKLSVWGLYIARNEIPARHGYIFGRSDLKSYFGGKSWYRGTLTPEQFVSQEGILNSIEEANVNTILALERELGSSYAP